MTAKFARTIAGRVVQRLTERDVVVVLPGCPDCQGRGWFLINPFAFGGDDGCGGIGNKYQCETCAESHRHYQRCGKLPPALRVRLSMEWREKYAGLFDPPADPLPPASNQTRFPFAFDPPQ